MSVFKSLKAFFEQGGKSTNRQLADKFGTDIGTIRSYISKINKCAIKECSFMITKYKHPKKQYAVYTATYQGAIVTKFGRPCIKPRL